jgi:hypothetical protein
VKETLGRSTERHHAARRAHRIGEPMSSGASLVISDKGLGPETGKGTDIVVLTPLNDCTLDPRILMQK